MTPSQRLEVVRVVTRRLLDGEPVSVPLRWEDVQNVTRVALAVMRCHGRCFRSRWRYGTLECWSPGENHQVTTDAFRDIIRGWVAEVGIEIPRSDDALAGS